MLLERIKSLFSGEGRSAVVKRNVVGSFLIKGVSILVSFFLVPVTIGYVDSELYGVWLTVSSVMMWIHFLDIGFSQGLKNKLTEAIALEDFEKGRSLVTTTYVMLVLIFVPVCFILELLIPHINWAHLLNVNECYSNDVVSVMHVVIGVVCLQMIINVIVSVIAAFQKVALSTSFGVIGNFLSLIIIIVLKETCPPSLLALALTLTIMPTLVTIIASIILFKGRFKKVAPQWNCFNRYYIKDLFSLGYKFFIINIQVLVLFWSTNFLISYVSSPVEVTKYNIAYQLLSVAMMAYTIITAPLWPAYTDAYARGDYNWMMNMKNRMQKILLLSIAGCFLLLVLSPVIYKIWIGDRVEIPFIMTTLVAFYVSAYCWSNLNGTLIVGMGKLAANTRMCLVGMFLHIPFALFLSKYIGVYGVIVSMLTINLFYAIVQAYQVKLLLNKKASGIWNK